MKIGNNMNTVNTKQHFLFDPIQYKEFGDNFYQGEGFSYRYQQSKNPLKLKKIYIPFGPIADDEAGFDAFLEHIQSKKFTKTTIDLPMIYNKQQAQRVSQKLIKHGFVQKSYVLQDEETLLVLKQDFTPSSSKMKKIRYGQKRSQIRTTEQPTTALLNSIYEIYKESLSRIGARPKPFAVFGLLAESCILTTSHNSETDEVEGFLFSYHMPANLNEFGGSTDGRVLLTFFTGLSDQGRINKAGHAMHYEQFMYAFDNGIEVIDFHGASRTKQRSYVTFKSEFSDHFVALPGSFTKRTLF